MSPVPVYLEEPYKRPHYAASPVGQSLPVHDPAGGSHWNLGQYLPVSGSPTFKPTNKLPYSEHFNLMVERELGKSFLSFDGLCGLVRTPSAFQIEANPGDSKCLSACANPWRDCGPFGEDQIYNLGGTAVNLGRGPIP